MTIKDQSLQTFLDNLASSAPTPGGGSAAGLTGGMSAALISMVCNLTIGKEDYAEVEDEIKEALKRAEDLRAQLTDMIRADVDAFNRLMSAYAISRESEEGQAARREAIQAALKEATDVPLNCARNCAELITLCRTVAEKGNLNLVSDAGVAVVAADAALKSAALNVYINVASIKDRAFAEERAAALRDIIESVAGQADEIYELVKGKL